MSSLTEFQSQWKNLESLEPFFGRKGLKSFQIYYGKMKKLIIYFTVFKTMGIAFLSQQIVNWSFFVSCTLSFIFTETAD